jgi:hypothetical protein
MTNNMAVPKDAKEKRLWRRRGEVEGGRKREDTQK